MIRRLTLLALAAALLGGCGSSDTVVIDPGTEPPARFDGLEFGTAATFEVVTWNLNYFPVNDDFPQETIARVADAIRALDADVVALQEVDSSSRFDDLLIELEGWDGRRADGYLPTAFVWNTARITPDVTPYQIFDGPGDVFHRPPLVLETTVAGRKVVVVNNHYKCCGDNVINPADEDDEEYLRQLSSEAIDGWIRSDHPDDAVIVLGDLNDLLTDAPAANVFNVFLDAPEAYRFTDYEIAAGSSSEWSWKYRSHLDHILVTDELFGAFDASGEVQTFHLDSYLEGWNEYETYMSDHLPVGLKLDLAP